MSAQKLFVTVVRSSKNGSGSVREHPAYVLDPLCVTRRTASIQHAHNEVGINFQRYVGAYIS